jgi:hypothetical protein
MSAKILEFPSIVSQPSQPPQCRCPRHELEALADRIRARIAGTDSLLLPISDMAAVLDDLTTTSARLLPPRQRTKS